MVSLDPDRLFDRQRLKHRLVIWRSVAVILAVALFGALFGITDGFRHSDSIARLSIEGIIISDHAREEALARVSEDEKIQALIVYVDSPGGTVVGGESLYQALRRVGEEKPVVIVMGEVAASAGYMIALGADRIFARPGTVTGSIGVIMQTSNITGFLDKLGISTDAIKSGPLKAVPSPLEPLTPAARQATQNVVLDMFNSFVDLVSVRRLIPLMTTLELADGRIFTGRQALEARLIDEIGGQEEALAWLERQHGIDAGLSVEEVEIDRGDAFYEKLSSSALHGIVTALGLPFSGKMILTERVTLDGLVSLWQPEGY